MNSAISLSFVLILGLAAIYVDSKAPRWPVVVDTDCAALFVCPLNTTWLIVAAISFCLGALIASRPVRVQDVVSAVAAQENS